MRAAREPQAPTCTPHGAPTWSPASRPRHSPALGAQPGPGSSEAPRSPGGRVAAASREATLGTASGPCRDAGLGTGAAGWQALRGQRSMGQLSHLKSRSLRNQALPSEPCLGTCEARARSRQATSRRQRPQVSTESLGPGGLPGRSIHSASGQPRGAQTLGPSCHHPDHGLHPETTWQCDSTPSCRAGVPPFSGGPALPPTLITIRPFSDSAGALGETDGTVPPPWHAGTSSHCPKSDKQPRQASSMRGAAGEKDMDSGAHQRGPAARPAPGPRPHPQLHSSEESVA